MARTGDGAPPADGGPLESNWAVARRAKARGARVVLNLAPAQPAPADVLPSFDLIVLNEIEAGMLARAQGLDAASGEEAGRAIALRFGVTTVVSLGSAGAIAFASDEAWRCGALAIEPVDTVGAAMPSSPASPSASRKARRCPRCSTGHASSGALPASWKAPHRRCRRRRRSRRVSVTSRRRSLCRSEIRAKAIADGGLRAAVPKGGLPTSNNC